MKLQPTISKTIFYSFLFAIGGSPTLAMLIIYGQNSLYTTNFTEPLSYQGSAFLKLPKFP